MAALLPLFAASVLPAQLQTLVCRMTGAVMAIESGGCPAPAEGADSSGEGVETVSDLGCCVVQTIDLGRLLAEHRADGAPPSLSAPAAATSMMGMVVAARPRSSARQDRPPPAGPPLLLVKRSFLI